MKKVLIIVIGVFIIACNQSKKSEQKSNKQLTTIIEKIENFDWLLGKWKRINETEGKETFEKWNKIGETEYSGIGFTMQNGDTIKQEHIRLIKSNKKWNLTVKVPEESESITFNGTSHNDNEFTCENNDIDFPNKIKYWKNGQKINAAVSNSEMEISFEFKKIEH